MTELFDRDVRKSRGTLVCIGGFPGSGKTTVGSLLRDLLSSIAVLIDSDRIWQAMRGKQPEDSLKDQDVQDQEMFGKVTEVVRERTSEGLRNGKVVIIPTAFMNPDMRSSFQSLADGHNAAFHGFWLVTSQQVNWGRAAERDHKWQEGIRDPDNVSTVYPPRGLNPYDFQKTVSWTPVDCTTSPIDVLKRICGFLPLPVAVPEQEEEAILALASLSRPAGVTLQQKGLS